MSARRITDEDRNAIYLHARGELEEDARIEIERRLASDPNFAAEYEAFVEIDLVADYVASARASMARPRGSTWLALAAVALAALGAWAWLAGGIGGSKPFDLAIVATARADDLATYAESIGVPDPHRVPASSLRAADRDRDVVPRTVDQFLQVVTEAERARSERAFDDAATSVSAGAVTLRFRPERECSALVIQLDTTGTLRRLYPSPDGVFVFEEARNRFAPGRTHVLPRPVVIANPNRPDRVATHAGFDVPEDLDVPRIWLVLAVREEAVDAGTLAELDAVLGAGAVSDPDALASSDKARREPAASEALHATSEWLRARGFAIGQVTADGS